MRQGRQVIVAMFVTLTEALVGCPAEGQVLTAVCIMYMPFNTAQALAAHVCAGAPCDKASRVSW